MAIQNTEFIPQNSFQDDTFARAAERGGPLARVIGGQNLRFKEFFNRTFGSLGQISAELPGGGGSVSLDQLIFDPGLRHVRGAKSATDFLLTHLNKIALRYAYKGVETLGKNVPGGVAGLTFWFGLTAHLYQKVAINATQALGGRTEENRWADLIDTLSTVGNPYSVATYLGYASNAALSAGLREANGSLELSNLEYDINLGLVSKRQSPSLGAKISYRNDPLQAAESESYYNSLLSDSQKSTDATVGRSSFNSTTGLSAAAGQFENDPKLPGFTRQIDAQVAGDAAASQQSELKAVEVQNKNLSLKHGGAVVLESDADVEDDGSDED